MKSIQRRESRCWSHRPAGDSVLEFRTLTQYRCTGAQQPKEVPQVRRAERNRYLLATEIEDIPCQLRSRIIPLHRRVAINTSHAIHVATTPDQAPMIDIIQAVSTFTRLLQCQISILFSGISP